MSLFSRRKNPFFDPNKYHHTPTGFRNPPGSPRMRVLSAEMAREAAHFLGEMRRALSDPYPFPASHVIPAREALQGWVDHRQSHKVLWLGHACFLLSFGGVHVLTDPFLTDYASPIPLSTTRRIVPSAIPIAELPPVHVILLSHNHYDHLDAPALKQLAQRFPLAQVVVPLGLKGMMEQAGFSRVQEGDWWDVFDVAGISVRLVPAVHTSRRGVGDTNRSLWCGFAFGDGQRQVYFAGDTAYGAVFREIGSLCGPFSLGLVPIGAYEPRILMQSVHCTPEEAIQIGIDIGARHLVGMHWGTIRLTVEPMLQPKERFLTGAEGPARTVLRIGETIIMPE